MQDIAGSSHVHNNLDHPLGPFLYTISTMHCTTVSLAQGGEGLGTMWGEEKATADARGSRLRQRGSQATRPRYREHLLHRQEKLEPSASAKKLKSELTADSAVRKRPTLLRTA